MSIGGGEGGGRKLVSEVFGDGDCGVAADRGRLGGDGNLAGEGVVSTCGAEVGDDIKGVTVIGEDVTGDGGRGDGDVQERGERFRSISPSVSRSKSISHRRFAAILVRLAGGEVTTGGRAAGGGVAGGSGVVVR